MKTRYFLLSLTLILFSVTCYAADWNAKWIQSAGCTNSINTWQVFRKVANISQVPQSVSARIAVDSKYWLWVNGQAVVFEGGLKRGPSPAGTYYDVVELAPYLKSGSNTIAILTQYFGKDGFSHKSSGMAGLLFDAEGKGVQIVSDDTWEAQVYKAYKTSSTDEPNYRLPESAVMFDANKSLGNWYAEDFDNHFANAVICQEEAVNSTFGELVERPIPQWKNSGLKDYVSTEWDESTRTLTCRLPYNAQVTPYIKLTSSRSWGTLDIRTDYFATSDGEKSVHLEYTPCVGEQEFEGLSWINGTEVIYTIPAKCEVLEVKYRETGYDTELSGSFTCNNSFWNELWNRSSRTMYVCMRDTYFDCPNRERAQWIGDVANEIQTASYSLSPSSSLIIDKCIHEVFAWQRDDGTIFGPVPAGNWDKELPVQMLMFCGWYGLYQQYLLNADSTFINEIYDGLHRYLHEVWQPGIDGFVPVREGGWSWGDWGDHIDMELLTNCWYYLAIKTENAFARMLGRASDVQLTEQLMALMKENFDQKFWSGTDCRSSGYTIEADDRSNALAVLAGLVGPDKYKQVIKVLKSSCYASPMNELYIQRALFQMGEGKYALSRARTRYTAMLANPLESTLYEYWNGGSHNHAWSAGMNVILGGSVCGIQATSPGYANFDVCPDFAGLTNVDFQMETPHGFIRFKGEDNDSCTSIDLTVPEGTEAHVVACGVDTIVMAGQYQFAYDKPIEVDTLDHYTDMTSHIEYPSFDQGSTGWVNDGWATCGLNSWTAPADGTRFDANYLNLWNSTGGCRVYQLLSGLPNGTYKVSFYAFTNSEGFQVYAGDSSVDVDITSGADAEGFFAHLYEVTVQVTDGTLEIGARAVSDNAIWAIIDNVSLAYYSSGGSVSISPTFSSTVPSDDAYYNLSCQRVSSPRHGIYIRGRKKIFIH